MNQNSVIPVETLRLCIKERLNRRLAKQAAEPADLRASDPYEEYRRRSDLLRKTGGEMTSRDMILACMAVRHLLDGATAGGRRPENGPQS